MCVGEVPPRLVGRRLLALLIDWAVVWAITAALLLSFLRPDEGVLRLGAAPVSWTSCTRLAPPSRAGTVQPDVAGFARMCTQRTMGFYNGRIVVVQFGGQRLHKPQQGRHHAQSVSVYRSARVWVDGEGNEIAPFIPQLALVPFGLMTLSAIALGQGWRTPGKRMAGLQVRGRGCAMCRELRRLGVFVVAGIVQMLAGLAPAGLLEWFLILPWAASALGLSVVIALVLYYLWPLAVWRGAMPYDRATGFQVVRAG